MCECERECERERSKSRNIACNVFIRCLVPLKTKEVLEQFVCKFIACNFQGEWTFLWPEIVGGVRDAVESL